jgi:hypothetical protein
VSLGRAHCQVATLQEAFSVLFNETYVASVQRAEDDIKEYQMQRKKLESRRYVFASLHFVIRLIADDHVASLMTLRRPN